MTTGTPAATGPTPLDRVWLLVAVLLPALVSLMVPLPAVDLAYQVRAGNEILATGAIPHADTWTFTVWGTAWLDQQWLAQLLLAIVHRAGGWELLVVLRAALVAVATGLLAGAALARGAGPRTAAVLALVAFGLAAPALALRPQLFGLVLFACLLLLLAGRHRWPRAHLAAPLLVVAWANVHGSFVLAPVLLGWAWLEDLVARDPARRRSLWLLVLGSLATFVTPFTLFTWTYAAGIGANPAIAGQVSEWQRTSPLALPGLLFYPSVVIAGALLVRERRAVRWPTWLLGAAFAGIGAWAVRGVAWWAFVLVLVLACLPVLRRRPRDARPASEATAPTALPRVDLPVGALLGVLVLAALPWWRPADPLAGRAGILAYAPTGIAAALRDPAIPGDRVLAPQLWASWLEWAAPDRAYFLDSRFELFPADVWADYAALRGPAPTDALARWSIEVVVLPAGSATPAGWHAAYEDADGMVLVPGP